MFKRNKTKEWLKTKSDEEKEQIFKACIKLGRQQRLIHRQRNEEIVCHRQQVLKKREQAIVTKQEREREKKEKLCKQISKDGFWNSDSKVLAGLAGKTESQCRKYLEVQLRFRQHVLKHPYSDKSVYHLSRNGKKLTSKQLSANLLKLISAIPTPTMDEIIKSPKLLIGMEIKHQFEDQDGIFSWYDGFVVGMNDSEHEVIYREEETIFQFDLLQDLMKGDLKIVFLNV